YREANVISCLKHFPGHGQISADSHHCLPISYKTWSELEESDLLPFAILAGSAETMMTAHILFPNVDSEACVTLSKTFFDLLREKLKFQGVVISDSLAMRGVLQQCSNIDEAAVKAFQAGCDLLLLGGRQLFLGESEFEVTLEDALRI